MSKKEVKKESTTTSKPDFVFGKKNYTWMIAGVLTILLGFILMSGSEDILDFRKITLAPIVVLAGFGIVFYAILIKPRD